MVAGNEIHSDSHDFLATEEEKKRKTETSICPLTFLSSLQIIAIAKVYIEAIS